MFNENEISRRAKNLVQDRRISVAYGYIVDVVTMGDDEEESLTYTVAVTPARSAGPPSNDLGIFVLEEPMEHLSTSFGSPRDLVGMRVRIDYFGDDWTHGTARLVGPSTVTTVGTSRSVPSRGFRYAVAGGGSV